MFWPSFCYQRKKKQDQGNYIHVGLEEGHKKIAVTLLQLFRMIV
jgi:hypothetical protein